MMSTYKLLVDTNVVIPLEDAKPVGDAFAALVRGCSASGVRLFITDAILDDVNRDTDIERRTVTLSKLAKFERLRPVPFPSASELSTRFGPINSTNDWSDVRLLATIDACAADFLITQDVGLHRRARKAGISAKILTVEDALQWLYQTFQPKEVKLPYVVERFVYELDRGNDIFSTLRNDYDGFDDWLDNCAKKHRLCWSLEIGSEIAGLVIRKENETHSEAMTEHFGPKILKLCTFKVKDEYRGEKFGEQLLKQALWFAQKNKYDLVYLTAFPKQAFLIDLLTSFGFSITRKLANGELLVEKPVRKCSELNIGVNSPIDFHRQHYPCFSDGPNIRKFIVPIQPDYHRRLFPEISFAREMPLFPSAKFGHMLAFQKRPDRTPGNTIRKVYLCRAKTTRIRPGDLVFFYMSKCDSLVGSQTLTSIGVVEKVTNANNADDLVRLTAKRSVFSEKELLEMAEEQESPVRVIDFLLSGHLEPFITLGQLLDDRILTGRPPQSIMEINPDAYSRLRPLIEHGMSI